MKTRRHEPVLDLSDAPSLQSWRSLAPETASRIRRKAVLDCGWGRLIFGHTFDEPQDLVEELRGEEPEKRDIALYLRDPHVVVALAPQEVFLDPSHTYRLDLAQPTVEPEEGEPTIRRVVEWSDARDLREVYRKRQMVPPDAETVLASAADESRVWLGAFDPGGGLLGAVLGVDHVEAFGDPEGGSSLWALAVDPQAPFPGVGRALTLHLARFFRDRGRQFMDLSVLHDNAEATTLYESLGFQRVPAFCVKYRNGINEPLFVGREHVEDLNPYAEIIVNEARRRNLAVEVVDAENGYFRLHSAGRSVLCRESLSELTGAVAMSRCDDKLVTHRVLTEAGLRCPDQIQAATLEASAAFLRKHASIVVKPRRGEQGRGISVDVRSREDMAEAVERAGGYGDDVLLEQRVVGEDLRVIVIDREVVAAAVRRPPEVVGTGRHTIAELIEKQSRRRSAATGGESCIPLDGETRRCLSAAGRDLHDMLPEGARLRVRDTANLHTGGTIHDVTERIHPELRAVSVAAASAIDIPVTGLDLIVPRLDESEYWIIEANERPGLANHEPAPTAEAFIDLLFPETRSRSCE